MGIFSSIKSGLSKSSSRLSDGLKNVFVKKKLDEETLGELEELLVASDMGAHFAGEVIDEFSKNKFNKEVSEELIKAELAKLVSAKLIDAEKPLELVQTPTVIVMMGVNGNGKTTTTGKLALKYKQEGKKVLLAACDTFRAAAVEQLKVWGERCDCEVVTGQESADPASVAYEAFQKAKEENIDVLFIDTAGRLHNNKNLMQELNKINRVLQKIDEEAPHHKLLVLDATTGQNAVQQAQEFKTIADITGIIITKLDGTAKGGILVSIVDKFNLPIHAIGIGEKIEDLKDFNANDFALALLGE